MDIRLLKYFIAVVEEGSITKAAKRLNMSQPPLSKQIKQLEEELGVILFIRGKKNIQLTEAGIFFKSRAEEIISATEILERQVAEYREGNRGSIIIGAVEGVATNYLPEILRNFQKKNERITYEIWAGSTDDILKRLDKGIIDIGFIRSSFDEGKYNNFELLRDCWGILIPKEHPLATVGDSFISAEMLVGEPLIVPSTPGRVEELQKWFGLEGIEPEVRCYYNVLAIGEALVKKNMGIALVLADYTDRESSHYTYKNLIPKLSSSVNVLWSKNHYLSEAAGRFVDFMVKEKKEGISKRYDNG